MKPPYVVAVPASKEEAVRQRRLMLRLHQLVRVTKVVKLTVVKQKQPLVAVALWLAKVIRVGAKPKPYPCPCQPLYKTHYNLFVPFRDAGVKKKAG